MEPIVWFVFIAIFHGCIRQVFLAVDSFLPRNATQSAVLLWYVMRPSTTLVDCDHVVKLRQSESNFMHWYRVQAYLGMLISPENSKGNCQIWGRTRV